MRKSMKSRKGFTLVELLIVVVILGILAAVAIPRFLTTRDEAQFRTCQSNLAAMNSAIEEWTFMNPTGTLALATVTADTNRFPDGAPLCPKAGTYSLNASNRATCTVHGSIETPILP